MNEQIRELAEQAGFGLHSDGEIYTAKLEHLPITENMEKFAELIVRECIDEIKNLRRNYDTNQDVEPEENDWYVDALLQAEVRLKEHFGM